MDPNANMDPKMAHKQAFAALGNPYFYPPPITANDLLQYHREYFHSDPPTAWMEEHHMKLQTNEPLDPAVYFANVPYMLIPKEKPPPAINDDEIQIFRASELHQLREERRKELLAAKEATQVESESPEEKAVPQDSEDSIAPGGAYSTKPFPKEGGNASESESDDDLDSTKESRVQKSCKHSEKAKKPFDWKNIEVTAENPWTARRHARESDVPKQTASVELDYGD